MGDREINDRWASWLRRRMRAHGYTTPTELARASGVDQSVISRWLNEGRTPKVDQLRKVTEPLAVSMLELLLAAGYVRAEEISDDGSAERWQDTADVAEAIRRDDGLIEEARQHLLSQYELLTRLSEPTASKEQEPDRAPQPAQRPLRAVARKRPPRSP